MSRSFRTFLGVDLGGGKGKTTAVARLVVEDGHARVVEVSARAPGGGAENGHGSAPFYDHVLCGYLARHADGAVLGIDAPLTTTACVRCRLPECKTLSACDDPAVAWFRDVGARLLGGDGSGNGKANGHARVGRKPAITPYTQRACEVLLHAHHQIGPRETLGQGMGPLTARAAYLQRALERQFRLGDNLIEVYPKATLTALFGRRAQRYKRHPETWTTRAAMLEELSHDLRFDVWREGCLSNDHCFDAVVCAYTAYLWARDGWEIPAEHRHIFAEDGWIWFPPMATTG
ncbi:MAG: DUF429 domain-containing protein [Myxococcota bacterium]